MNIYLFKKSYIIVSQFRKAYLKKNRGCEEELHERLEKKLPNF